MEDHYIIKIDEHGDFVWDQILDGGEYGDNLHNVMQTPEGGYVISGGSSYLSGGGMPQPMGCMYILHTDGRGRTLWDIKEGGSPYATLDDSKIIRTQDEGYIVQSNTLEAGGGIWVIKLDSDPVSVDGSVEVVHPYNFVLLSNYPNPFNSTTTINYGLPTQSYVSLGVYNMSGRIVNSVFDGYQQAGFYSTTFSADNLSSGLYFIRLFAFDQMLTEKIMVIK